MKPLDILLIEDCLEDIDLAKEVLDVEKINNRLKIVNDGEEAMAYLKKADFSQSYVPPDVIVLDLNIPKKNGFQVLKEIFEDSELKKIPVIIFTTSDLSPQVLEKYHLNSWQYVKKTFNFHELIDALKAIGQREGRKDAAPVVVLKSKPKQDEQLNILLIEDNIEDAELIEELLKKRYFWKITHFERLNEAIYCLKNNNFDVVILDLFLPDTRGLETLKMFVSQQQSIPIIVMTSLKNEEIGRDAIREGAQDYLVKGQISSDFFIRSVEYAIERKKLAQLKDDLLSYVNHELSNPLTVIKESIAQINEGLLGEINQTQKHFLSSALSSIDHLITITEDLLVCTKLELGKLSIEKETFSFDELVQEIAETFQASFSQKGLELKVRLTDEYIDIYADRGRLYQVLTNLLSNALKFTTHGFVEIVVEEHEDSVQCVINDTGQGIAESDIPRLFKKYEQLLAHKQKTKKGTGLGLFFCKMLVELHGGHIQIKSRLGKGTQFIITLPKKAEDK